MIKDRMPIQLMYELLTAVANATYITRLDMKNVFNLV
jgi:hypothetical protein